MRPSRSIGLGGVLPPYLLLTAGIGGTLETSGTYWAYREEGEKPPEDYRWHMGMYDLESECRRGFLRTETPVVGAFRAATERISGR
jgi:hypothetical protein